FQAEDGIRDWSVTGVQTCALPIFATPTAAKSNVLLMKNNSVPSKDQNGRNAPSRETCRLVPVLEKGCTQTSGLAVSNDVYATHRSEERRVGKEGRSRVAPDQ